MEIDIYCTAADQSYTERVALFAAWKAGTRGRVGRLTERCPRRLCATEYLFRELFYRRETLTFEPKTSVLRERLPRTLELAKKHLLAANPKTTAREIKLVLRDYTRFVEFCERKEAKTGKPLAIMAKY